MRARRGRRSAVSPERWAWAWRRRRRRSSASPSPACMPRSAASPRASAPTRASMALLAFGGAGPMLGCFLARELGMAEVLVPPTPGVLSALGGLIADLKSDFLRDALSPDSMSAAVPAIREGFAALRAQALAWLREEQGHAGPVELTFSADLRYRGQSYRAGGDAGAKPRPWPATWMRSPRPSTPPMSGSTAMPTAAPRSSSSACGWSVPGQRRSRRLPKLARASGAPKPHGDAAGLARRRLARRRFPRPPRPAGRAELRRPGGGDAGGLHHLRPARLHGTGGRLRQPADPGASA